MTDLMDFESDHKNPLDLCYQLEKRVMPIIYIEGISALLCLTDVRNSWGVFLGRLAIIGVTLMMKKKTKRFFDPITIVRDMQKIKIRHVAFIVISVVSIVWILIGMMLTLFK